MNITVDKMYAGIKSGFDWNGLKVYPLLIDEYEANMAALSCLTIMHQAMPFEFLGIPYLRMLHNSAEQMPELYGDHIVKLRDVIVKSFRVSNDRVVFTRDNKQRVKWYISFAKKKAFDSSRGKMSPGRKYAPIDLNIISATNDEEMLNEFGIYTISESNFMKLRELICKINALEVPDESVNLDIWQSYNDLQSIQSTPVEYSFESLLFAVSAASHISVEDLRKKSLWEFSNIANAHDRILRFIICALAESNGAKYKNGNPVPDWRFDKKNTDIMGMVSYSSFSGELGKVANMK